MQVILKSMRNGTENSNFLPGSLQVLLLLHYTILKKLTEWYKTPYVRLKLNKKRNNVLVPERRSCNAACTATIRQGKLIYFPESTSAVPLISDCLSYARQRIVILFSIRLAINYFQIGLCQSDLTKDRIQLYRKYVSPCDFVSWESPLRNCCTKKAHFLTFPKRAQSVACYQYHIYSGNISLSKKNYERFQKRSVHIGSKIFWEDLKICGLKHVARREIREFGN